MTILALEFSSEQRSVAVVDGPADGAPRCVAETVRGGGRATPAAAMIEEVLERAGLRREAVECIAVGLGPGSYHGVRCAIALAQGWQLARGVRLVGINSVEAMAAQAHAEGLRGPVAGVVDAQRGELYVADYALDATGWRETGPLRLASPAQVQASGPAERVLLGPEVSRWFSGGKVMFPRAGMLGRLAPGRSDAVPGERLEPVYLRAAAFQKVRPSRLPV